MNEDSLRDQRYERPTDPWRDDDDYSVWEATLMDGLDDPERAWEPAE